MFLAGRVGYGDGSAVWVGCTEMDPAPCIIHEHDLQALRNLGCKEMIEDSEQGEDGLH